MWFWGEGKHGCVLAEEARAREQELTTAGVVTHEQHARVDGNRVVAEPRCGAVAVRSCSDAAALGREGARCGLPDAQLLPRK